MNSQRWQLIARICVFLAIGSLAVAWWGYTDCMLAVTDGMTRELNPLTERELEAVIETALANVDEAPTSFGDRASLAHPLCYDTNSIGDNGLYYALFVFLLIIALFCRNQAIAPGQLNPQGRNRGFDSQKPSRNSDKMPDEIDIGDVMVGLSEKDKQLLEAVGDVNVRDESLMLYLQTKQEEDDDSVDERTPHTVDGFFCPPGYHNKPIVYVDPGHVAASDELSGEDLTNNTDRPFKTLSGALDAARKLLKDGEKGVMLRAMPGVYHASIEIPDGVVVCNHRLPAEGTPRTRLQWLTAQTVDDADNVTILTPPNAQYAVQFEAGTRQGIFGCHIVGRESVMQAGVVAVNCRSLAIVNCSIESFIGGGLRIKDAGTELPGGAVLLYGCRLHRNESRIGGAIYAQRSSLSVADCIIEYNKALTGGGIYGIDLRGPLFITSSRIAHNRAQLDEPPKLDVESTGLESWQKSDGLGGGVYLKNSKLKVAGAEFVENGASVAGGGIALLNAKAVMEEADGNKPRLARNKSRLGAGIVAIGWANARATLKCSSGLFERNTATIGGGGLAAVGLATVQVFDTEFRKNEIAEKNGFGAGALAWMGGELLLSGVQFNENKSAGHGAGVAVVNARLSVKGDSELRANIAKGAAGGVYVITTASEVVKKLVQLKLLKVPFVATFEHTKIVDNISADLGGGMRAGNDSSSTTLPLGLKFGENVRFQLNRTQSQKENGDDFWVVWGGEVKGTDRDRPEKLVLS